MKKFLFLSSLVLFVLFSIESAGQALQGDPLSKLCGYSGTKPNHIPKGIDILYNDSSCRQLANKCIFGATMDELNDRNMDSVKQRISRLMNGEVLKLKEGKYYLTFPVIVGKKRDLMYDLVRKKAADLVPRVIPILVRLKNELGNRQDITFHMFWSRIIDETFWPMWQKEFPQEPGPPAIVWAVYPEHSYMVGTNYNEVANNAQIAITWNYCCENNVHGIMQVRSDLYKAITGGSISESNMNLLKKLGFADQKGGFHIFSYREGGRLDSLCQELKSEYMTAIAGLYDYHNMSKILEIHYDELYLILMHETAYALFENLQQLSKLEFPSPLKSGNNSQAMVQLVSLKLYDNSKK